MLLLIVVGKIYSMQDSTTKAELVKTPSRKSSAEYKKSIDEANCCAIYNFDPLRSDQISQINADLGKLTAFVNQTDNGKVLSCVNKLFPNIQPRINIIHFSDGNSKSVTVNSQVLIDSSKISLTCMVSYPKVSNSNRGDNQSAQRTSRNKDVSIKKRH